VYKVLVSVPKIIFYLQGEVLDESTLKRLILLFEKRALKNQEMRIKFPDMPEKYVFLFQIL
jgi:beta-catenin-like protein 1